MESGSTLVVRCHACSLNGGGVLLLFREGVGMMLLEDGEHHACGEEMGSVWSGTGEGWHLCEDVCARSRRRRRGERGMPVGKAHRSRALDDGVGLRRIRRLRGEVVEEL